VAGGGFPIWSLATKVAAGGNVIVMPMFVLYGTSLLKYTRVA
jgi:hypothetical protein